MSFRRIEKLHWQTALTENLIIEMYDTWSNLEPGLFVINDEPCRMENGTYERSKDRHYFPFIFIIFFFAIKFARTRDLNSPRRSAAQDKKPTIEKTEFLIKGLCAVNGPLEFAPLRTVSPADFDVAMPLHTH